MVARSCDPLDGSGEPAAGTHSVVAPANHKIKMNKRLSVVKGHFPKLADCAHFHYDNVDFGSTGIQLQYYSDQSETNWTSSAKDIVFMVQVTCQGKSWMVRRSYEEFSTLDAHLHQCIYDRRYSQLAALPSLAQIGDRTEILCPLLSEYLSRLSIILDDKLNCGPVLTWMEIDNRGNRFLLKEEASLNVPAIAAAHVTKRYTAQASDEISIEVGDILSVIDMPPREETSWWRGKQGFQVGFFPSECVELIHSEQPHSVECASSGKTDADQVSSKSTGTGSPGPASPTSVHKKHGKLLGFLRTFIKSRPSKQKLKQRGILKERVFGCDLGEHLLNSGLEVPQVLTSCSEFIEQHGVVDGIYRHSGVSSNIQRLRHEFDSEMLPDLTKEVYIQDIHCVGSLCKLYFRELPNPLLTYQLYDKFADCMGDLTDDERMAKVHDVIQQLPPPHYRTLEYLIRHLARLATCSGETNMHIKNLAIVWAPNLLRSKEIETAGLVGSDPFKEVRVQSVVVEFLLSHVDVLFSDSFTSVGMFTQAGQQPFLARPKSFVSTRLLSLEEAQARTQAPLLLQGAPAPPIQQGQYHTVLDVQDNRRKRGLKERKSAGSWKTFFAIGKSTRKPMRISSLFQPTMSNAGCHVDSVTLRSAKSEESLSSQHSGPAPGEVQRLRRPRSSSDGLSLAAAMETHLHTHRPPSRLPSSRSYDSLLPGEQRHDNRDEEEDDGDGDEEDEDEDEDGDGVYMMPDFSNQGPASSWMAEDVIDFSPTFLEDGPIGLGSTRDSPPTGSPPAYHCLNHQVQRPITEDPDSVLNQSEAVARRSLILAATAPPQQVFCQHRPSNSSPEQGEAANQNASQIAFPAPERRSFTKKMVHALSSKPPTKALTMDISQPIAISVPAKVLEMIGGRAGESQQPAAPGGSAPPPQMISMLLRSCDFQLSDSCQQELHSKLGTVAVPGSGKGIPGPTGAPLPPQQPPPPPPKNPARLMALVLAESANRALRQGSSPPYHPPTVNSKADRDSLHQLSLSADASELLASEPTVYSSVVQRPLSAWMNNNAAESTPPGQATRTHTQDTGTLSSETSVSDSVATDQSGGSSSGDEHTPSPVYTNQSHQGSGLRSPSDPRPARRKPPAYGRQLSAPHLHQKTTTTASSPASALTTVSASVSTQNISVAAQQPQLQHSQHSQSQSVAYPSQSSQLHMHHSRSESSPLSQAIAHQPGRPKVPPKPLDLVAPQRDRDPPTPQRNRDLALQVAPGPHREHRDHNPLTRSELRRSLDADRVRRLVGEPPGGQQPPLARAFSERLSGAPDRLARYHAARAASQPVPACPPPPVSAMAHPMASSCSADDQGKMENFYYEIGAPRGDGPLPLHPHPSPSGPPSYARHAYLNMRSEDFLGRPLSRGGGGGGPGYHGYPDGGRRGGQPWSSDATRAWVASRSLRCHDDGSNRPRLQRQPVSSSVRLPPARSEMHPLANASFSPLVSSAPPQAPATPQAHPAPLHPYFQNGRVYYRSQPDEGAGQHGGDRPEPVYVNYPFTSSSSSAPLPPPPPYVTSSSSAPVSRGWATSDLDPPQPPPHHPPSPLLSPLLLTPPDRDQRDSSSSSPSPPSLSPSPVAPEPTTPEPDRDAGSRGGGGHHHPGTDGGTDERERGERREDGGGGGGGAMDGREWRSGESPPAGSRGRDVTPPPPPPPVMSGQDIAALLMEKMTQEEREETRSGRAPPDAAATTTSPPHAHPPNPYAPAPPPPPYHHQAAQRGEAWWRAASAGGQRYRQVFDVLPSGDQVLRFHRSEEEAAAAEHNPFPTRSGYQEPPYPLHHRSSYPSHQPTAPFGGPRGNYPPPAQSQPQHTSHYPPPQPLYPPRREMIPDPGAMRGQRGLVRQGSLPGAPWSQTRSYC